MNGQAWTTAEPSFGTMDAGAEQSSFGGMEDLINFDTLDLDLEGFNYNGDFSNQGGNADMSNSLHVHDFSTTPQIPQYQHNGAQGGQQHNMPTFDYSMGQFSQAGTPVFPQAQDHMFRPHHGVPPTPNSVEMHGDPHRYMQHMESQQALFDQRYHMRKEDAVGSTDTKAVALRLTYY
jgi:hypothetical protein